MFRENIPLDFAIIHYERFQQFETRGINDKR